MKIHFTNARLLTMAGEQPVFRGDLITENDRILYCGPKPEAGAACLQGCDRVIDAGGNLIMPGFKNAHTHSPMTFLRSLADDMPLDRWLNEQVFPREAKLTGEDVYWLSKLAFLEYLTSGITACFDMYIFLDAFAAASVEYGFRTVFCGSINRFGGSVQSLEDDYEKYNRMDPLLGFRLGFHAEYTTDKEMIQELGTLAQTLKAPVYAHNSETRREVEDCILRYGRTPTELMEELGLFEYGGGGFHCVHFTERDRMIFAEHNLYAITNPASNLKLASGIADLTALHRHGIKLAIGTDGPASNNCLDMFREMFLAAGLQKVIAGDASAMPYGQVLDMAVCQGARAMGLLECDCLAPGKMADLIMINLCRPNMQPLNNIAANLVYSGSKDNVCLTMIGGRILYENGEFFVGQEPSEVYENANRIVKRIAAL